MRLRDGRNDPPHNPSHHPHPMSDASGVDCVTGEGFVVKNKHWPQIDINLNTIAGSMEAGVDLFLLGNFGGFGGCLYEAHIDLNEAKEAARNYIKGSKRGSHTSVYRLKVTLEDEMLDAYQPPTQERE
jgi:hypothetical protein